MYLFWIFTKISLGGWVGCTNQKTLISGTGFLILPHAFRAVFTFSIFNQNHDVFSYPSTSVSCVKIKAADIAFLISGKTDEKPWHWMLSTFYTLNIYINKFCHHINKYVIWLTFVFTTLNYSRQIWCIWTQLIMELRHEAWDKSQSSVLCTPTQLTTP